MLRKQGGNRASAARRTGNSGRRAVVVRCFKDDNLPSQGKRIYVRPIKIKADSPFNPAFDTRKRSPVLSFDGGGMRGLLAARVAEQVESSVISAVREYMTANSNAHELFEWQVEGDAFDQWNTFTGSENALEIVSRDLLAVYLADYFDVMCGTSTGAILASYFATKGGSVHNMIDSVNTTLATQSALVDALDAAVNPIEAQYEAARQLVALGSISDKQADKDAAAKAGKQVGECQKKILDAINAVGKQFPAKDSDKKWDIWAARQYRKYMRNREIASRQELPQGSARAAQTTFVANGKRIFDERSVTATLPSDKVSGVLRSVLQTLMSWAGLKLYSDKGVSYMLQQVLGKDTRMSNGPDRGGVHTALVIPAFHVQCNRATMFWMMPQPPADGKNEHLYAKGYHGYATVHRDGPNTQAGDTADSAVFMTTASEHDDAGNIIMRRIPNAQQSAFKHTVQYHMGSASAVFPVDFDLWTVVRSSTAAPTFFPAQLLHGTGYKLKGSPSGAVRPSDGQDVEAMDVLGIKEEDITKRPDLIATFVDGGLVANDPTQEAINCATMFRINPKAKPAVLSIGCSTSVTPMKADKDEGALSWLVNIAGVLFGAMPETTTASFLQYMNSVSDEAIGLRVQAQVLRPRTTLPSEMALRNQMVDNAGGLMSMPPPSISGESGAKDVHVVALPLQQAYYAQVLDTMDVPEDWAALLEIGEEVAAAYKADIDDWVRKYVVPLKPYRTISDQSVTVDSLVSGARFGMRSPVPL